LSIAYSDYFNFNTAVFIHIFFAGVGEERAGAAVADGAHTIRRDTLGYKIVIDALGTSLGKLLIVFVGAADITVSFDAHSESGICLEHAHVLFQYGIGYGEEIGFIESKVNPFEYYRLDHMRTVGAAAATASGIGGRDQYQYNYW